MNGKKSASGMQWRHLGCRGLTPLSNSEHQGSKDSNKAPSPPAHSKEKRPPRFEAAFFEFANRKIGFGNFSSVSLDPATDPGLVLLRGAGGRRGGVVSHRQLLRVILNESQQIAVAPTCIEIIVLHFVVSLIEGPVVHVEPVDGAYDSGAMTAARTVYEHHAGGGVVNELEKRIDRFLLRIARVAHGNIHITHSHGFGAALLVAGRAVLEVHYRLDAQSREVLVILIFRLRSAIQPVIHLAGVLDLDI